MWLLFSGFLKQEFQSILKASKYLLEGAKIRLSDSSKVIAPKFINFLGTWANVFWEVCQNGIPKWTKHIRVQSKSYNWLDDHLWPYGAVVRWDVYECTEVRLYLVFKLVEHKNTVAELWVNRVCQLILLVKPMYLIDELQSLQINSLGTPKLSSEQHLFQKEKNWFDAWNYKCVKTLLYAMY